MVSAASERELPATQPAPSFADRTFPRGVRATAVELLAAYVLLTAIWVGVGLLITGPLNRTALTDVDQDVATWMVGQRTSALDDWSEIGSLPADTLVKIIATAVIAAIMLAIWRSWREPLMISLALVLEASVFITTTWIVARPRPDVEPLDSSPVDSSFPSGHTAAAAAYGAIAVVIFQRTRNVWIRGVTVVVTIALPIVVGVARMYRGMHFLTDVVAGTILGVASVVVVYLVFRPARAGEPPAQPRR